MHHVVVGNRRFGSKLGSEFGIEYTVALVQLRCAREITKRQEKTRQDANGHYAEGLQKFDIRRFWHSFVERIWIVAICVLAGFFLALGYLARTPKLYQATVYSRWNSGAEFPSERRFHDPHAVHVSG